MRVRTLTLAWAMLACADPLDAPRAPVIEATRPTTARSGATVTLVGDNFGLQGERDRVWLGGVELEVLSWGDTAVDVRVPADNGPGVYDFVVRTDARVSRPFAFEVLADVGTILP